MENLLPNFLIIGAMKSGTTSLYDDLKTSSQFYLPDNKEPAILVKAKNKEEALKQYRLHFKDSERDSIRGEASTYYTMQPLFPDVSKFAKDVIGSDLKLVVILRNPIDRIISHVCHDYSVGRLNHRNIDRAIQNDNRYVSFSNYAQQLKPWIDSFGQERLFCISFKDYVDNRLEASRSVAAFLDVDPMSIKPREKISNQNSDVKQSILPLGLLNFYRENIYFLMPKSLKKIAINFFTKKRKSLPPIEFSDALRRDLEERFHDLEKELILITGKKLEL